MDPRGERSVPRERDLSHSHSYWRMQGTQLIQAERPGGHLLSGSGSGTSTKQEQDFRPKKGREHGRRKDCKRPFISFKIFFLTCTLFLLIFIESVAILLLFYVLVFLTGRQVGS